MNPTSPQEAYKLHNQSIEAAERYFKHEGWATQIGATFPAPSGTPVHTDLVVSDPTSTKSYLIECKFGTSGTLLPLSAFAQVSSLSGNGTPILVTNMEVPERIQTLFTTVDAEILAPNLPPTQTPIGEHLLKAFSGYVRPTKPIGSETKRTDDHVLDRS
jgi:hypothetical protein